jgi:hypothetical protein
VIRAWLAKEIAGDRVTMFVTETQRHPGGVAVLAKVTGDYDKTGLPDPLELRFYFTLTAMRSRSSWSFRPNAAERRPRSARVPTIEESKHVQGLWLFDQT